MLLRLIFRPNETGRKTANPFRSKRHGADLTLRFHAVGCEFSLSADTDKSSERLWAERCRCCLYGRRGFFRGVVYSNCTLITNAVALSSGESRPHPAPSDEVNSVSPSAKPFRSYQLRFHSQPRL